MNFPYGRENLRQILIKIGFQYRKRGRERIFYERGDIVSWREKYLRRIKQIREQEPERDIVYLDETWLTEGHQKNKEWVDTSTLKDPQKTKSLSLTTGYTNLHVGKGRRIVISDAITENDTVPGALWIYIAVSKKSTGKGQTKNKKKGGSSSSSRVSVGNKDNDDNQGDSGLGIEQDYHDEMDHEKYKNYFETQICKNASKNSALVIDNASYHSKYSEDHPKSTWKKAQYAEWLKKKDPLCKRCYTTDPMEAGKEKRENYPAYWLEKIAYKYGHEIVRLPPYNCQLNAIELIWGIEKNYVASENKEHKLSEVEDLFRKKREEIDQETCKKCIEHVKRIEEEFYKSDRITDVAVEKLEININPNSDSQMSDMSDLSESDDE